MKCTRRFRRPTWVCVAVPNMPNYFMFLGPANAPASGSFIPTLELVMDYIIECKSKLQRESYGWMEPTRVTDR